MGQSCFSAMCWAFFIQVPLRRSGGLDLTFWISFLGHFLQCNPENGQAVAFFEGVVAFAIWS